MKNLLAATSYSFNNFYNNLNTQGQMIFSIIMFLILALCVLLFITYVFQGIKNKSRFRKIKTEINNKKNELVKVPIKIEKEDKVKNKLYVEEKTEIEDIAKRVEDAISEDSPIILTNFEEDQEKTAIISIDELMDKARELELIVDDENTGINYLEKYNLEPSEIETTVNKTMINEAKGEVKAFSVSQVISPIYGVKKEAIKNDK